MIRVFVLTSLLALSTLGSSAQGLANMITTAQWDSLFPQRAGTTANHPQGYTTDFFSYQHLNQAMQEMADYKVEIKRKPGVWGEVITVTRKTSGFSYLYADVEPWWYSNTTPMVVSEVDFADFVNTASALNNKRELAAFLANISKETTGGWQFPIGGGSFGDYALWGLYFVHEVGYTSANSAGAYSQPHAEFPPNPTKGYYGRGPIQLSWNYNYGQFSKFLYNDATVLLNDPDSVQRDGVTAFKSALWFWMMPQCPKPSCHQVMHDQWLPQTAAYAASKMYQRGFAHTNNIINGGLECRSASSTAFTDKVVLRSGLYKYYLGLMGVSQGQIAAEDSGQYTTLCFDGPTQAMENYLNCDLVPASSTGVATTLWNEVRTFPNPATELLQLELPAALLPQHGRLLNMLGETVLEISLESPRTAIPLHTLPAGMYLLQLGDANQRTIRLLKH